MSKFDKLGVLLAALCALSAFGAGTASAKFTSAVKPNPITGGAIENQVFTYSAGNVTCTGAAITGTAEATESGEQEVSVHYSGCKANGVATAHVSDGTYRFTTNVSEATKNQVHVLNTITITVTKTIVSLECTMTVGPQTLGTVHYINEPAGVVIEPTLSGIHYQPSGNPCGTSTGSNGTFTGKSTIMGESGSITVDD